MHHVRLLEERMPSCRLTEVIVWMNHQTYSIMNFNSDTLEVQHQSCLRYVVTQHPHVRSTCICCVAREPLLSTLPQSLCPGGALLILSARPSADVKGRRLSSFPGDESEAAARCCCTAGAGSIVIAGFFVAVAVVVAVDVASEAVAGAFVEASLARMVDWILAAAACRRARSSSAGD